MFSGEKTKNGVFTLVEKKNMSIDMYKICL